MTEKTNGNGNATVQLNPREVAQHALMFLARCDLKPAERQGFANAEMLLQAIANGQVQLMTPPPAESEALASDAPAAN